MSRPAQASLLIDLPAAEPEVTPLMAQYFNVKARHADCLLFFRLGDFYEMFFEDAVNAAKALDIALTRRGQHQGKDIPMCGVPAHSYEAYLTKLIRAGFRVAICEQQESPAAAKKRGRSAIVTRDVVRIITPGTLTEDNLLEARASCFLACLAGAGDELALAWLDLAAGRPCVRGVTPAELPAALAELDAAEILVPQRLIEQPRLYEVFASWKTRLNPQPNSRFDGINAAKSLRERYQVAELDGFGSFGRAEIVALGGLLAYAELTQKSDLRHLAPPQMQSAANLAIDPATRRNLELVRTLTGDKAGSLLATIDRTLTGAGARLLCLNLTAPLTDVALINRRLDAVAYLVTDTTLRQALRAALNQTPELERALARLALGRGGPRDLAAIRDALMQAEAIRSRLLAVGSQLPAELRDAATGLGQHAALIERLARALAADLPLLARDGNFIARGFNAQLDELIVLRDDSRRLIASLQQQYCQQSGVTSLKIRHNNVIGYYIEVTPQHADRLLALKDIYIHRQSLASAVRFTTVELGELARKITEAADKALAVELQLFADLTGGTLQHLPELRQAAAGLAALDVAAALAELAVEQNYTRPVVDDSLAFSITGGRHPVVEQALRQGGGGTGFVANACDLDPACRLWLLTGPNMAGKSTFLRQNALIVLLAQMGSFVPAASAQIGVVDRLFSRVGAADDLARGRSTFMVEMVETAAILNQAGERALVILDEIGRGTSTYDGLSLASAVLEHLHETNRCRALFATHYHELTQLAGQLPHLRCATMRIREWEQEIVFLHEVIDGVASRSYGLHVARMAGLPGAVLARAASILHGLESAKTGAAGAALDHLPPRAAPLAPVTESPLAVLLKTVQPDTLSPREALDLLYQIKALATAKAN